MWQFDITQEFFYVGSTILNLVYYFFFYTLSLIMLTILFKFEYKTKNKISKISTTLFVTGLLLLAGLPPMPTFFIKCFFLFKFATICSNTTTTIILILFLLYWFIIFKFIINLFFLQNTSTTYKIRDLFNLTLIKFFFLFFIFYFFYFISFLVIL